MIPNLNDKHKYIIHYRNLKQCIKLGLELKKIHKILEFDQSPWMKKYIDLNTKLRKKANNDFDRDFYKLMNNSIFGKCMENIRNRIDVQFVKTERDLNKLIKKPNLDSVTRFTNDLVACHMKKQKLIFDKPIYIGLAVLDISKILMYDFHYNTIKKLYKDKAKLLFTDTDSLCYHIETNNLDNDRKNQISKYDTSNYPEDHILYSNKNKKVLGKFKDETAGAQINEFVGLRSKLYCYSFNSEEIKKAKGISKTVINKNIRMDEYKRTLFNKEIINKKMIILQSKKHDMDTVEINKIALSSDDDKRYILPDNIHTLALGHYRIK